MTELTPSLAALHGPTGAAAAKRAGIPSAQGLYDPRNEHDACGVGFIAQMKGVKSHQIVADGLAMLENLTHRGAVGADPLMGDGAGVLVQVPDRLFREEMAAQGIELPPVGQYGVGHWFMPQDETLREHLNEVIVECAQLGRPAADRLPRRAGRQLIALQGARHRGGRALPSRRSSSAVRPKSPTRRSSRHGSTCCAR